MTAAPIIYGNRDRGQQEHLIITGLLTARFQERLLLQVGDAHAPNAGVDPEHAGGPDIRRPERDNSPVQAGSGLQGPHRAATDHQGAITSLWQ